MTINLPIKKDPNTDAQRQGHVGYNKDKIYPLDDSGSNPYVTGDEPNAERVKRIFDNSFTVMTPLQISNKMLERLGVSNVINDNFNPDFESNSVSYKYNVEQVSANKNRGEDLFLNESQQDITNLRKAPNVAFPSNEQVNSYENPFVSETSNGGFGNDKFKNSLHDTDTEGELDSLEVFEKYE
jgi:hypothetical protein